MERAFNFKLLVPPRTSLSQSQVSAVKPQDSGLYEDNDFLTTVQGYNKCFDKVTSLPFSNTSMVLPTKSSRAEVAKKIAVMPMEKEEVAPLRCSQLYSKLFEEAEKIKSWKLKVESEILQKDKKLQENRRTIETQRKAIQELQFGNESLSMKLEEQLNENEDLRNKNNATRNLCNILKDTFERSTEKINMFEAEREETHGLFVQNHENIQRMVAAFENLRMQAEADQLEMLKVREGLKQFEELKLRFENECHLKEEEVSILERKIRDKEIDFKEMLLNLQETQQSYKELQESAKQHQELLLSSKQEQDKLEEKLKRAEKLQQEAKEHQKHLDNMLEQTEKIYLKNMQEKDAKFEEVNNIKERLEHELEERRMTTESLQSSLTFEKQRAQVLDSKLSSLSKELDKKNVELGKTEKENKERDNQIQHMRNALDMKSNAYKLLEEKIKEDGGKILQLLAENEGSKTEINHLKKKLKYASTENLNMVLTLEQTMNEQKQIKEHCLLKEMNSETVKLSEALKNEREASTNLKRVKKDLDQHKAKYEDLLERFHQLELQKNTMQQQVEGGASENKLLESCLKETKGNEEKMKMEIERLKVEKQQLEQQVEILSTRIEEQCEVNKNIQQQLKKSDISKNELMKKERQIKTQELKLTNLKTKLESKSKALDESLKANKALKKQMALEKEKLFQYEDEINKLKEKSQNINEHHEEELKRLSSELENKSNSEAQLKLEVQALKHTAVEAVKSKEDTEIKCQQKISDIVALMERHKHEYDKMVEEKDAELNEKRMQETEVNANKTSLELELSHLQVENGQLKQQVEKGKKEKGHLEKDIQALKKHIKCLKKETSQKISEKTPKNGKYSGTSDVALTQMPKDLETSSKYDSATPFTLGDSLLKTPTWTMEAKMGTPEIRSFRIRTPPSTEKSAPWRKNTLELDPKSDSSERNDTLSFSTLPLKSRRSKQADEYGTECLGLLKKVHSSGLCKSPGAALKLAAMKRMRDAGWTSITNSDKKKKKVTDKIFA